MYCKWLKPLTWIWLTYKEIWKYLRFIWRFELCFNGLKSDLIGESVFKLVKFARNNNLIG